MIYLLPHNEKTPKTTQNTALQLILDDVKYL